MGDQDRKRKGKDKILEYEEDPKKRARILVELHGGGDGDGDRPARAPGTLRIPGPSNPGQNAPRSAAPVPNQPHQRQAEGQLLAAAPGALRLPGPEIVVECPTCSKPFDACACFVAGGPLHLQFRDNNQRHPPPQPLPYSQRAMQQPQPQAMFANRPMGQQYVPGGEASSSSRGPPAFQNWRPGLQQPLPQAPFKLPVHLPNSREGQRMWWQWVERMARDTFQPDEANRQKLQQQHLQNVMFFPSPIPQDQRCWYCGHNARRITDFPWRHVCPCIICCYAFRVLCLVCASVWMPVPACVGLRPPQPPGPQQHPQPPPPVGAGVQQLQNQNQNQNQSQVVSVSLPEPSPYIPSDFLCPGCHTYRGRITAHWPHHVCLCDACSLFGVPCRFCPSAQTPASQGGGS